MKTAKLFQNGTSQAVRLPKAIQNSRQWGKNIQKGTSDYTGTDRNYLGFAVGVSWWVPGRFFERWTQSAFYAKERVLLIQYLLDTDICIYLIKKHPPKVIEHFMQHLPRDVAISVITLSELEYGVEKSRYRQRSKVFFLIQNWPTFLKTFDPPPN